ncbi:Metallo-dependent phosphatase-like protein [Dichotomocladium elegans]|nr:Metallo-dependent phosphatase-like protein [Dichotomocladium elegans]
MRYLVFSLALVSLVASVPLPGSPGTRAVPDTYNDYGDTWNRTYSATEPQQIHIAWLPDGVACRIQFATHAPTDDAILEYWPEGERDLSSVTVRRTEGWEFVDGGEGQHTIYLHNLESKMLYPGTLYTYVVGTVKGNETLWSDLYMFHTPSPDASFEFIATADMGTSNAVSRPNLRRLAEQHRYDFMTFAGDQAYDMADFNGTKGDEYMNFVQDIYATIPVMAALGNHESAYNFSHYKNRFNILPYRESGSPDPTFYSFDYKALHFVAFSSEVFFDDGSAEQIQTALNWLDQDLTRANENRFERPWIIVMAHRPMYCSPSLATEDCDEKAEIMRLGPVLDGKRTGGLEALFLKHRVDIYLCGHRHNYERTFPVAHNTRISTFYRDAPAFFQLVVGNAGNFQGTDPFENEHQVADWSAKRYEGYGFSTIRVTPRTLLISHFASDPEDGSLAGIIDRVLVRKSSTGLHLPHRQGCVASVSSVYCQINKSA